MTGHVANQSYYFVHQIFKEVTGYPFLKHCRLVTIVIYDATWLLFDEIVDTPIIIKQLTFISQR